LAGRRIVITRAAEQADDFLARLAEAGATVDLLPMVRFMKVEDASDLDRSIAEFEQFDWLIFTSANAARFFLQRCKLLRRPVPHELRLAAVGSATRRALENEGAEASRIWMPRQANGAGLAAELGGELAGARVLIPRSDLAGDELPAALRDAGAEVTTVLAYHTAPSSAESLDAEVVAIIERGDVDAITFFSPSAFRYFAQVAGGVALEKMGGCVAFAAIGPTTAAAIREAGLPVVVEASEPQAESLIAALENYFAARPAGKWAGKARS
jgi:uroporphyrinogen-III synthase